MSHMYESYERIFHKLEQSVDMIKIYTQAERDRSDAKRDMKRNYIDNWYLTCLAWELISSNIPNFGPGTISVSYRVLHVTAHVYF